MRTIIWLLALLHVALLASSQSLNSKVYTQLDGLPSSTVLSVVQDRAGLLWVATRSGIVSYDGAQWTERLAAELPVRDALLATDVNGVVWYLAGADSLVIQRWVAERWQAQPVPAGLRMKDVQQFAMGQAMEPSLLLSTSAEELWLWSTGEWRSIALHMLPGGWRLHDIEAVGERFYLATTQGLFVFDPRLDGAPERVVEVPAQSLAGLGYDKPAGKLWLIQSAVAGGLDVLEALDAPAAPRFSRVLPSWEPATHIQGMGLEVEADGIGGVYFGTSNTLYHYHSEYGLIPVTRKLGDSALGTMSLLLDREGNQWIGTLRGLAKVPRRLFTNLSLGQGLFDDEVACIIERRDGTIILGHNGVLSLLKDGELATQRVVWLTEDAYSGRVLDMAEDRQGRVWIASEFVGLGVLAPDDSLQWMKSTAELGGRINSVCVDAAGVVWVAAGNGISRVVETEPVSQPIALHREGENSITRRLLPGPKGGVRLATNSSGLYDLAPDGSLRNWRSEDSGACNVFSALDRRDGSTWVGTSTGLFETTEEGLSRVLEPRLDYPVYFLIEVGERTWLGTDRGVVLWEQGKRRDYGVRQGLMGSETNRSAGLLDSRGRVWIGTDLGVSIYSEGLDRIPSSGPSVRVARILANGKELDMSAAIALESHMNSIEVQLQAISFVDEAHVQFRYQLEGFDDGWSEFQELPGRMLRYTNLEPGRYQMQVQAKDVTGRLSEPAYSTPILVRAAFWRSTWFLALMALLAASLSWALFDTHAQRRYARRLEGEVAARTSQLKQLEQQQALSQRLEGLGVLAGGIAHDFNNLLTSILGNLQMLEQCRGQSAGELEFVREALGAATRAKALTQQLLTFAKGGAPVLAKATIHALVRESAAFALGGSNVRLVLDLPPDLATVEIDEGQISQVLNNLFVNARQALQRGGTLHVRGRNSDSMGLTGDLEAAALRPSLVLEIEDDGAGIPAHVLPRIFDPYFTTRPTGTGLGLAICYSIIEKHAGRLSVESTLGKGTLFRIYLPAVEGAADAKPALTAQTQAPAHRRLPGQPGARVLIMDDEAMVRNVIKSMLSAQGHSVSSTGDGLEAVQRYREALEAERRFDLVIMDLTVPGGMGGEEAVAKLLELDPEACVVVVSGYSDSPVVSRFAEHGFRAFLPKPFRQSELLAMLQYCHARYWDLVEDKG